jgi:hypothetical protein
VESVLGVRLQRRHDPARGHGLAEPDVCRRRDGVLKHLGHFEFPSIAEVRLIAGHRDIENVTTGRKLMKNKTMLSSGIWLLLGIAMTWTIGCNSPGNEESAPTANQTSGGANHDMNAMNHDMADMSMNDMTKELKGLTGDDFDKMFVDSMIAHHQGAIDMANLAKTNAKHQEVKDMADDIISAQSKEIEMMKKWKVDWKY